MRVVEKAENVTFFSIFFIFLFHFGLATLSLHSDNLGCPLPPSSILQKVILIFNSRKIGVTLQVPSSAVVLNSTDNWKISLIVEIWVDSTFSLQLQCTGTDFLSLSKPSLTYLFILSPLSSCIFYGWWEAGNHFPFFPPFFFFLTW